MVFFPTGVLPTGRGNSGLILETAWAVQALLTPDVWAHAEWHLLVWKLNCRNFFGVCGFLQLHVLYENF